MRRRALLSSLAATALPLAAGCSGAGEVGTSTDRTPEPTPTQTPDQTPTQTPDEEQTTSQPIDEHAQVTVQDVAVQQGYVVREVADAIGVIGDYNRYVWAHVTIEGAALSPDTYALDTSLQEYDAVDSSRAYRFEGDDSPYSLQSGGGWLLFELPMDVETPQQQDVPEMAITNPVESIELDRSIAERIAHGPPTLSVSMTPQYRETPSKPVAIEVTNEGGADHGRSLSGRFVGALNRQGVVAEVAPVQRVVVDVPPGESRTVEIEEDWHEEISDDDENDQRSVEYALNWAADSTSVTIEDL